MDEYDFSGYDVGDYGGIDYSALENIDLGGLGGLEGFDLSGLDLDAIANIGDVGDFDLSVLENNAASADVLSDAFNTPDLRDLPYDDMRGGITTDFLDPQKDFEELMTKQGFVTFDTPKGFVTYRPDGTVETGTNEGRRSYYTVGDNGASFIDYANINDPRALVETINEEGRNVYYHTAPRGRSYVVDYANINSPNEMVQTTSSLGDRNFYFDGNYVGYDEKGNVTTAGPSGSGAAKTVYNKDGSVTEYKKDGSSTTTYRDGSKTSTSAGGEKTRAAGATTKNNQNNWLKALLPLMLMMAMRDKQSGGSKAVIPALTAVQKQTPYSQQRPEGYRPGQGGIRYFEPVQYMPRMAGGGIVDLARALAAARREQRSRLLKGRGDGVSDSIPATIDGRRPARLARGEYVVDARTVAELGNGSTDAGAERLDEMRRKVLGKRKKAGVGQDSKAYKHLPA